jgi:glycosidase
MGRWLIAVFLAVGACSGVEDEGTIATHVDDWRDEVIYQIVVDRFDNGDLDNDWLGDVGPVPGDLKRFQGGDWAGIRRRLDYLEGLGVTTLWISPIVSNVDRTDYQDGYHGYWASDFTSVNRRFGDLDELRGLVDAAHDRDMKVIIDVVVNHTGRVFFYDFDGDGVLDPGEDEPPFSLQGPYDADIEWLFPAPRFFEGADVDGTVGTMELDARHFHRRGRTEIDVPEQKELGDFPTGLRDLDTESPEVARVMVDTFAHWVELTDVDGFRLDAVPHAPHAFWSDFATAVRARLTALGKRRFMLLGEVFDGDPERLAGYTDRGGLDAVFDFTFKSDLIDAFILDGEPASRAVYALEEARRAYPASGHLNGLGLSPWQARVAFADNHDVPRVRHGLDDPWAAELAMTAVFTVDAIPSIYYGTEQELSGGWGNASREALWEAAGFSTETRMYRHLARLARVRRESPALRYGGLVVRFASETSAREQGAGVGLLAWERHDPESGDRVLVALNGHPIDAASASVPTGFAPGTRLRDALHPADDPVQIGDGGEVVVRVAPRAAVILIADR